MVKDALWIGMASILSVFSIDKPIAQDGSIVEPAGKFMDHGVIMYVPVAALHLELES
jgi:hypothetical protein